MRLSFRVLAPLFIALVAAGDTDADTLDIHFIDVEGGAATLIVTPERQSVLIDAGYRRDDHRDVERIERALRDAGVTRIDYFVASHFHGDHVGGLAELAKRVPIGTFIDHGDSVEQAREGGRELWETYRATVGAKRRTVAPGDELELSGVDATVVASAGRFIAPLAGRDHENPHCGAAELRDPDEGENGQSVGILFELGAFQFLALGDLTWNLEVALACPENRVGKIDLFLVTHHGVQTSVPPQQVWSAEPRVAVMNNGPRKGGYPGAYEVLEESPNLEAIWQLHRSLETDAEHNPNEAFIANLGETDACEGHGVVARVEPDGRRYSVTNTRNGETRTYETR